MRGPYRFQTFPGRTEIPDESRYTLDEAIVRAKKLAVSMGSVAVVDVSDKKRRGRGVADQGGGWRWAQDCKTCKGTGHLDSPMPNVDVPCGDCSGHGWRPNGTGSVIA